MNKLNPLRTSYDLDLELDNTIYKVVFKPVNKHTQAKLDALRETSKEQYLESDAKRLELKEYKEFLALNNELLAATDEITEKKLLLLENKGYLQKINSLDKEIKDLEKDLQDVNEVVENYYKELLDTCLAGEDKVKFLKAVDESGLSYSVVNVHLYEVLRVAQEKK